MRRGAFIGAVVVAVFVGGLGLAAVSSIFGGGIEPLEGCKAIDGDTLNCNGERVRLIGIDAPELSSCHPERQCVAGDPYLSTLALATALPNPLGIERMGEDRYGRTLAHVYILPEPGGFSEPESLACLQLVAGVAEYTAKWDNLPHGRVAKECGL